MLSNSYRTCLPSPSGEERSVREPEPGECEPAPWGLLFQEGLCTHACVRMCVCVHACTHRRARRDWWFLMDTGFGGMAGAHNVAESTVWSPVCLPGFLFALLCPRMPFDLSLPPFGPPVFPAFLQPSLVLPLIFCRLYGAGPAVGIRELVCSPPSPAFGLSGNLAGLAEGGQLSSELLGGTGQSGLGICLRPLRGAVEPPVCVIL